MRTYAILDNNIVTSIIDAEEELVRDLMKASLVIDIQDQIPQPQVGWVLSGNILVPPVQGQIIVPEKVTPRQIRIALVLSGNAGILSNIDSMIEALPEPDKSIVKVTWEYSTEIQRTNPYLAQFAGALGFTENDLDNLFIVAQTL